MRYAQYAPSPALASVVEWYWVLEGSDGAEPQPIVPDGRVEIIFHFGDRFDRHHPGGIVERQDPALLVGQLLAPIRIGCRGRAGVAAIRLRPAAVRVLAGCAAADLTGRTIDLEAMTGSTASLRERLALAAEDGARVRLMETWLAARVRVAPARDVVAAVEAILSAPGAASLRAVAAQAGIGVRQLERRFLADVGIPPKTFARIARLQRALGCIAAGASLADAAHACGYYDQPHMTHDFARLAETSPSTWRTSDADLTRLFVTGEGCRV
jgi:AraC-like DNA-binding protein